MNGEIFLHFFPGKVIATTRSVLFLKQNIVSYRVMYTVLMMLFITILFATTS